MSTQPGGDEAKPAVPAADAHTQAAQGGGEAQRRQMSPAGKMLAVTVVAILAFGAWMATAPTRSRTQAATPQQTAAANAAAAATALNTAIVVAQASQAQWWAGHQDWAGYTPAASNEVTISWVDAAGAAGSATGTTLAASATSTASGTCGRWTVTNVIPTPPVQATAPECSQEGLKTLL